MRPKPLIPTRTAIGPLHISTLRSVDYSRARGPSPIVDGRARARRAGRPRPATGSTPQRPDRVLVGRRGPVARRYRNASTRAPWSSTAAQMVGAVEAGGLGHLGPQVGRPGRPRPAWPRSALAQLGHAEHREQRSCRASPGAQHDLVGGADRVERRRACAARRRARARPAGSRPVAGLRPRPGPRPASPLDVGLEHDRIDRGRQHPADRVERGGRPRRARR